MIGHDIDEAMAHSAYDEIINTYIMNDVRMPRAATEEAQAAEISSEQFELRRAFLFLARDFCVKNKLAPGSSEAFGIFDEAIERANDIIYSYFIDSFPFSNEEKLALTPSQIREKLAMTVSDPFLINHIEKHGKLKVSHLELSNSVGNYIKGRFKSPDIDRILLRALSQVEITSYIHEMTFKDFFTGKSKLQEALPPSLVMVAWRLIKRVLIVWMISAIIVATPFLLPALSFNFALIIGLSVGGVGTLYLICIGALAFIIAIEQRPYKRARHKEISEIIDGMTLFYAEFKEGGPFSLSHFKRRANEMADQGVVWPGALFALIDDMQKRDILMF